MIKAIFILQILFVSVTVSIGQVISIANEKENVVTVGLVNPISVAVENVPAVDIILKTDNGELLGKNGIYDLRPLKVGKVTLTIFQNRNGKLKEIGKKYFRAKLLWDPIFKIGSGKQMIPKAELVAQQYVQAQLENSDFSLTFNVDSFKVCIIPSDNCKYVTLKNIGNKINEEINKEFRMLHTNDAIIFKDIYCSGPDGQRKIEPVIIFIYD